MCCPSLRIRKSEINNHSVYICVNIRSKDVINKEQFSIIVTFLSALQARLFLREMILICEANLTIITSAGQGWFVNMAINPRSGSNNNSVRRQPDVKMHKNKTLLGSNTNEFVNNCCEYIHSLDLYEVVLTYSITRLRRAIIV